MTKKDWRKVFNVCAAIIIAMAIIEYWMGIEMHPINQFFVGLLSVECVILVALKVCKTVGDYIYYARAYKKLLNSISTLREYHSFRYKACFCENPENIQGYTENIQSVGKSCLEFAIFINNYKYLSKKKKLAIQSCMAEVNYLMSHFLPQKRAL